MKAQWHEGRRLWFIDLPSGIRIYTHLSGQAEEVARATVEGPSRWKWGWLTNKGSAWIGVHYSKHNLRWCINLIPCVTLWITRPGGETP